MPYNNHKCSLKHVKLALYKVVHLKIARKSPYLSAKFKVRLTQYSKVKLKQFKNSAFSSYIGKWRICKLGLQNLKIARLVAVLENSGYVN